MKKILVSILMISQISMTKAVEVPMDNFEDCNELASDFIGQVQTKEQIIKDINDNIINLIVKYTPNVISDASQIIIDTIAEIEESDSAYVYHYPAKTYHEGGQFDFTALLFYQGKSTLVSVMMDTTFPKKIIKNLRQHYNVKYDVLGNMIANNPDTCTITPNSFKVKSIEIRNVKTNVLIGKGNDIFEYFIPLSNYKASSN